MINKIFFLTLLSLTFFMTSCEDNTDEVISENFELQSQRENGGDKELDFIHGRKNCFKLVYPLTIILGDEEVAVTSKEELKEAIRTWKENGGEGKPEFVFPIEVENQDGDLMTIESSEELRELREDCDFRPRRDCFKFVYPLTIILGDNEVVVNSGEEMREAILEWKENGGEGEHGFVYPFEVITKNDVVVTVENLEQFRELKKHCRKPRKHRDILLIIQDCYDIVFPLNFVFPDETIVEVSSLEELKEEFTAWKEANPDIQGRPQLTYPLTLIDLDGNEIVVESQEALKLLLRECHDDE